MKILERSKDFGKRLVEARKEHGMRAKDAADLIGVTASTMSRFENGARTPDVMQIKRLAEAININLHWLITGYGSKSVCSEVGHSSKTFEIIHKDNITKGRIIVPGSDDAVEAYQVEDMFMAPRIMENDYVLIDRDSPKLGDLVAFRDVNFRFRVGWLRNLKGEKGMFLVSENPDHGNIPKNDCEILGKVICSVRVDYHQ